jgi:hypothetical protein
MLAKDDECRAIGELRVEVYDRMYSSEPYILSSTSVGASNRFRFRRASVTYSGSGSTCDAFASLIDSDARQKVDRPITLTH